MTTSHPIPPSSEPAHAAEALWASQPCGGPWCRPSLPASTVALHRPTVAQSSPWYQSQIITGGGRILPQAGHIKIPLPVPAQDSEPLAETRFSPILSHPSLCSSVVEPSFCKRETEVRLLARAPFLDYLILCHCMLCQKMMRVSMTSLQNAPVSRKPDGRIRMEPFIQKQ